MFERRSARADGSADQWTAAARAWRSAGNAFAADHCYRNAISKLGYDTAVWLEYVRLLNDRYGISEATNEVALRQRQGRETSPISDPWLRKNDGNRWRAPHYPRIQLAGNTTLQRLLITMRHLNGMASEARKAMRQFVELTVSAADLTQTRVAPIAIPTRAST